METQPTLSERSSARHTPARVEPARGVAYGSALALWSVFFGVCLGLGYAVLNRFDPTHIKALSDSIDYAALTDGSGAPSGPGHRRYRMLVPWLARPFAHWVSSYYDSWNAVAAGMLASNSLFIATTLLALVFLAQRTGLTAADGLVAALCYASNFIVVNLYLVGLVDSAEACAATLLYLGLVSRRSWLLITAGVIGGLGKETFVVIGPVAALAYFWSEREWWIVRATVAMAAISLACVMLVRFYYGAPINPFALAASFEIKRPLYERTIDCLISPHFFYGLYWLLPAALWSLGAIPRPLRNSAAAGAGMALVLGIYHDARAANVARPIFSYAGAVLCLAASITLVRAATRLSGTVARP